jgi:hypothetical protein
MIEFLPDLFVKPLPVSGIGRLGMLVPLALMISIVYKTIRCERLRSVPLDSVRLCFMIVCCMLAIGVFLLVTFRLLA